MCVYDPEAKEKQIQHDLASYNVKGNLSVAADAYEACKDAHAIIVITEWKCVLSSLLLFSFSPALPSLAIFLFSPPRRACCPPFPLNLALRCQCYIIITHERVAMAQAIQGARLPTHFRCDEQAGIYL